MAHIGAARKIRKTSSGFNINIMAKSSNSHLPSLTSSPAAAPQLPNLANWWFSADGKRGFSWGEVAGYDFKKSGSVGNSISSLYLYLHAGIYRLEGLEAEQVAEVLLNGRSGK